MLETIKEILNFNIAQFHFLRAQYLWMFVPMALAIGLLLFHTKQRNKWKKVIAPALQPFMFTKSNNSAIIFPVVMFVLLTSIGIFALAGPTWTMKDVDGKRNEAQLVIALDTSLSMLAEDVQPNRLQRAKFKIKDLLDANPRTLTSLYAYSALPYMVVPACNDYNLIELHLDALTPATMPTQGTDLTRMVEMADSALANVVAPSTLLIVTDVVEQKDVQAIKNFVATTPHKVEILALATPGGAQIPKNVRKQPVKDASGAVVISKVDSEVLFTLQKDEKINVNSITLDDTDMQLLAKNLSENLFFQSDETKSDEDWKDMGYILIIILALIMPFWFRRGWMIPFCMAGLVLFSCSRTDDSEVEKESSKQKWIDLWETKDYQAQKLYDAGDYDEAAHVFESKFHKGVAYYKAGNFDAAAQSFEGDSTANAQYNLGLCYTQLGEYDKALQAIELASELDPNNSSFKDAIAQTKKSKLKADSLSVEGQVVVLDKKDEEKKEKLQEKKATNHDEELSSDTKVDKLPEDGKRITDEVESGKRKGKEQEEVPDDFKSGKENLPSNILLQGISESPQEFLRRRFKYQYKKYYSEEENTSQETW